VGGHVLSGDMGCGDVSLGDRSESDTRTERRGFLLFNITYAVTSVQAIAAGLVGLADKSDRPVFPRWVCKWAIFTGISFIPLTAMPFFKTGPLSWNGAICFWAVFGTYFFWTASMGVCMVKDASRRLRDQDVEAMREREQLGLSASA